MKGLREQDKGHGGQKLKGEPHLRRMDAPDLSDRVEGPEHADAHRQLEHHVLMAGVPERLVQAEIERHLRDQSEQKQPDDIAETAVRMNEALDQKKAEDREGGAANSPEKEVKLVEIPETAGPADRDMRADQAVEDQAGGAVVDRHRDDRDPLEARAVEDPIGFADGKLHVR